MRGGRGQALGGRVAGVFVVDIALSNIVCPSLLARSIGSLE